MKKINVSIYIHLIIFLGALLTTSCTSNSFKLDGSIDQLESPNIRIVFANDSGIVDEYITPQKGQFSFKAKISAITLVSILDSHNNLLAQAIAEPNSHIKLHGSADKPTSIKISGNDLNEQWQLFRNEHEAFYADPNPSRKDATIEKFIRENPDNLLSTVLLIADYSNLSDNIKVNELLQSIHTEAKPIALTRTYQALIKSQQLNNKNRILTSMRLVQLGGKHIELATTGRISLLYFWKQPSNNRTHQTQQLKTLTQQTNQQIHIADILIDGDTIRWGNSVKSDSALWQHYWAPLGPLDNSLKPLHITSCPSFAVIDSAGHIAYCGIHIEEACQIAKDKLNNHQH